MKDKYTNGSDDVFPPEPSLVLLVLRWNQRSGTMALNGNPLEWWELDRGNHPKSSPLYHIFSYIICMYILYIIFPLISGEWIGMIQQMLFWDFFATKNSRTHQLWFAVRYWCCLSSSRYCCCLSFWAFLSAARIFYWDEQEIGWNLWDTAKNGIKTG